MKILLAGDTHGQIQPFEYFHAIMKEMGITRGIVLGDFGLWPGPKGEYFLTTLENLAADAGITWDWLDGNHEWHDEIERWMAEEDAYLRPHQLSPHIYYLPRAYRFEIDGVKFMSLGGAWSIDQDGRVPFISWWPQEELTMADYMRAVESDEKIDVLLTHDMPEDRNAISNLGFQMHPGGHSNRSIVRAVMEQSGARFLFHGHMHHRYSARAENGYTQIEGLDCDGQGRSSYYVLETDDLKQLELDD